MVDEYEGGAEEEGVDVDGEVEELVVDGVVEDVPTVICACAQLRTTTIPSRPAGTKSAANDGINRHGRCGPSRNRSDGRLSKIPHGID